jgi:hypothetical protein
MSATTQTVAPQRADVAAPTGPSFTGAVRGELGKLRRQRPPWGCWWEGASSRRFWPR